MDYAIVASGSIPPESTNLTTRAFSLPSVQNGDRLVIAAALAGGSTTLAASGLSGIGAPDTLTQRSGFGTHAWFYELTAAQSSATVTLTSSTALKVAVVWAILRNVDGLDGAATSVNNTAAGTMNPPAFTPAAGRALLHVIGMATGSGAPPATWTPPSPMTVQVQQGTAGTTGRAGVAMGVLTTDETAISGGWSADVSNSWGIIALPISIVAPPPVEGPQVSVLTGLSDHTWIDEATADTLATPAPTTSTAVGTGAQTSGALLVAPGDARLRYRGAGGFAFGSAYPDSLCYHPNSRYPYGWGNPGTWAVEFDHTGSVFEVLYKYLSAAGAGWMRISADGQRVTDVMVKPAGTTGGSMHTHRVTFPSSATRRILLEFQGVPFGGIYLPTGNTLAAPPAFARRAVFEGDSITAGSDQNSGQGAGTWVARFAAYASIDDPWNVAIGGTGMTEPGTATTIPARIAQVTGVPDVDDIFLWCGGNDGATSILAPATTYIANIKAAHPDANIYVIGTWSPAVSPPTSRAARSVDLKNAAAANDVPFISPITGEVLDGAGVLVASQVPWISTSDQVAEYVSPADNVHPTDAGHAYIAQRMHAALAAITRRPATLLGVWNGTSIAPASITGVNDTAPPGTLYAWTGTPNASPSIETVDGVETRRNLALRPTPESNIGSGGGSGGWTSNGSPYVRSHDSTAGRRPDTAAVIYTRTGALNSTIASAYAIGGAGALFNANSPVVAGETYTVSTYVRTERVGAWNSRISFAFADEAQVQIGGNIAGDLVSSEGVEWTRIVGTAIAPAGAVWLRPILTVSSGSGAALDGERVWATDAQIEEGPVATDWFDGDTPPL